MKLSKTRTLNINITEPTIRTKRLKRVLRLVELHMVHKLF